MNNGTVLVLGLLFATLWIAQGWFATRQSKAFMTEVRVLRSCGTTAVGSDSSKFGRRSFVAMAVGPGDEVQRATVLDGVSLFARPERYTDVEGLTLQQIIPWDDTRVHRAAADAATHLLSREAEPTTARASRDSQKRQSENQ